MIGRGYDLSVVGNGRSAALVDGRGTVVFLCLPDFDAGGVFALLLDADKGGSFGVECVGGEVERQGYDGHTNLLVTRYASPEGAFDLIDFMPHYRMPGSGRGDYHAPDLLRVVRLVSGRPRLRVRYDPKLEFGAFPTETQVLGDGLLKSTTNGDRDGEEVYESVYLHSDLPGTAVLDGDAVEIDGDRFLLLSYNDKLHEPTLERAWLKHAKTKAFWLDWTSHLTKVPRYREEILRSALTLKLMQYVPTGALVAAVTTSLPEEIGGERNWDYRYCWLRDSSMAVSVLRRIGCPQMAEDFVEWVLRTVPTKDDTLRIMYGLRGERALVERTLDHLGGYEGSKPVRIGNAAWHQTQHDIYGFVLDVFWQMLPHFKERLDRLETLWTGVRSIVRVVSRRWRLEDRGLWEFRGRSRHFVFSKLLCWVALDRAVRIARELGRGAWADEQVPVREEIREDILARGWSDEVGAFTQSYGSTELDAANLLLAEYGFLSPDDERFVSTVERTEEELCRDGLLYRYREPDDFGQPESAFTVCSFWMVKALASIGRKEDARRMFESLLETANHTGLFSEDLDFETRRQLGNFPQAYCHLALIDCAMALNDAEGLPSARHPADECED